jgi:hypothetical protein
MHLATQQQTAVNRLFTYSTTKGRIMDKVTNNDLEILLAEVIKQTNNTTLFIGRTCGSVRLEANGGSVDVSPLLTKRELYQYMRAMLKGISLAKGERP